ncbi:MAG: response regulator [Gilliamella sp.]|nr:response regulator [Gilliamella sp.]
MSNMQLILVEDDLDDVELCKNAVSDFKKDKRCNVDLQIANDVSSAIEAFKSSHYDGAIVDMKLASDGDEGNQVLKEVKKQLRRVPVVIMSGTPYDAVIKDVPLVATYVKGDIRYYDIIKYLWDIYNTGLTKIMGGKGEIEKCLSEIFVNILLPQITPDPNNKSNNWITYAQNKPENTEKALLRYTLNHLIHYLYHVDNFCYPDEMYIYLHSPMPQKINTGCILTEKSTNKLYIVMNPECDLVERKNGECNTDRALLAAIQKIEEVEVFQNIEGNFESALSNKDKNNLDNIRRNKKNCYHWLPKTEYYTYGAVVNFKWLYTYSEEELDAQFDKPVIQVSSPFLKDIICRFSSYYARQGQPDIDYPE